MKPTKNAPYVFDVHQSPGGRWFAYPLNGPYYLGEVFWTREEALAHVAKHGSAQERTPPAPRQQGAATTDGDE